MENNDYLKRPFFLTTLLIVLSFFGLLYSAALIYTGIFFSEAQRGLEIYLSDIFAKFPFPILYILVLLFALILIVSVILMWWRKKVGVYLYFFWSFVLLFLLLIAEEIDWYTIVVLLVLAVSLALNFSYFSDDSEKQQKSNSQ